MARVQKREAAKRDLIAQWVWYAENAGIDVADRFLRKPELQALRRFPVSDGFEKILLFYFPLEDGVDLVRVVHGSRDLEGLLTEGFFAWADTAPLPSIWRCGHARVSTDDQFPARRRHPRGLEA